LPNPLVDREVSARRRLCESLLSVSHDYFNDLMIQRQRLIWTVATRRQLERWEPLVAACLRDDFAKRKTEGAVIWTAATEHHFALIAARNLLRALDLDPATSVPVDATLRDELIEGRDLHEHWPENMPVFNVRPRVKEAPYRSGKEFAARNPTDSPYFWESFNSKTGPELLPNVPAFLLHALLDAVEADVLAKRPDLHAYVPPRAPSPWIYEQDNWWPRPDEPAES
jgi:hypothetical protein